MALQCLLVAIVVVLAVFAALTTCVVGVPVGESSSNASDVTTPPDDTLTTSTHFHENTSIVAELNLASANTSPNPVPGATTSSSDASTSTEQPTPTDEASASDTFNDHTENMPNLSSAETTLSPARNTDTTGVGLEYGSSDASVLMDTTLADTTVGGVVTSSSANVTEQASGDSPSAAVEPWLVAAQSTEPWTTTEQYATTRTQEPSTSTEQSSTWRTEEPSTTMEQSSTWSGKPPSLPHTVTTDRIPEQTMYEAAETENTSYTTNSTAMPEMTSTTDNNDTVSIASRPLAPTIETIESTTVAVERTTARWITLEEGTARLYIADISLVKFNTRAMRARFRIMVAKYLTMYCARHDDECSQLRAQGASCRCENVIIKQSTLEQDKGGLELSIYIKQATRRRTLVDRQTLQDSISEYAADIYNDFGYKVSVVSKNSTTTDDSSPETWVIVVAVAAPGFVLILLFVFVATTYRRRTTVHFQNRTRRFPPARPTPAKTRLQRNPRRTYDNEAYDSNNEAAGTSAGASQQQWAKTQL